MCFLWLVFHFRLNPSPSHGGRKDVQKRNTFLPANARVRNALPVDKFAPGYEVLPTGFEVAFDHNSHDAVIAVRNLFGHFASDFDLAQVIFLAVGMTHINHHALCQSSAGEFLARGIDAGWIVIGLSSTTQDDVAVFVPHGGNDRRVSLFGDRQEMMWMLRGPDSVHRDAQVSVGAVLEPDRT